MVDDTESAKEYTRSKIGGVTPKRSQLSGYKERAARRGKPLPTDKITGSRVISDQNKRITTYQSGRVVVTDLKTGQSKDYTTKAGTKPQDISIPEENIMSYSQQQQLQQLQEQKKVAEERAAERFEQQQKQRLTTKQIVERRQQQISQAERQISASTGKSIRGDIGIPGEVYAPRQAIEVKGGYISPAQQKSVQADKVYVAPYKPFYEGQVSKPPQIDYFRTYQKYVSPFVKPTKKPEVKKEYRGISGFFKQVGSPSEQKKAIQSTKSYLSKGIKTGKGIITSIGLTKFNKPIVEKSIKGYEKFDTKLSEKAKRLIPSKTIESLTQTSKGIESFYLSKTEGISKPEGRFLSTKEGIVFVKDEQKQPKGIKGFVSKVTSPEFGAKTLSAPTEFSAGFLTGLREKPTKTIATTAIYAIGVPPLLKATGKVAAPLIKTTAGKAVTSIAKVAIPTAYASSIYYRSARTERPVFTFGKIASTEVAPMVVGGTMGAYVYTRVSGYLRTRGRTKIPKERLIQPEVLSGKRRFPEAGGSVQSAYKRAKIQKSVFEQGKYSIDELQGGFHATPEIYTLVEADKPLHIAPSISKNFWGTESGTIRLYGGDLFNTYSTPSTFYISGQKYKVNVGYEIKRQFYKWSEPTKPGIAYLPGTKAEAQGVFETGTQFKLIGKEYYTTYKGIRIPIDQYKVLPSGDIKGIVSSGKTSKSSVYSYKAPSPSYSVTPGSLSFSIINNKQYKASTSSDKYFKPQIYKIYSEPKKIDYRPYQSSYNSVSSSFNSLSSSLKSSNVKSSSIKLSESLTSVSSSYKASSSKLGSSLSSLSSLSITNYRSYPKVSNESYVRESRSKSRVSISYYPQSTRRYIPPSTIPKYKKSRPESKSLSKTFDVFLKRGGEFKPIASGLTKGKGLKIGVTSTKSGLGATFKLVETGKFTKEKDIFFKPSKEFRSFKIVKGRRIETPLQFIQRREFRLSSAGERKEIKLARLR